MNGAAKPVPLANRLLDDFRMIPRAHDLLERIEANAAALGELAASSVTDELCLAWEPLALASIAFCERLATRYDGVVLEQAFNDLDLTDVVFDDGDMAVLKQCARDPASASLVRELLEIVRQCRHIQELLRAEEQLAAA